MILVLPVKHCAMALVVASLLPIACFQMPASEDSEATPGPESMVGTEADTQGTSNSPTSTSTSASVGSDSSGGSVDTSTSMGSPALCGDGVVSGDEACDDGDRDDSDACTNSCTIARCGDGIKSENEVCDDGNNDDLDLCDNLCALPSCGDGVTQTGEECDDGGETSFCDSNCTIAACGDGMLNVAAGEICDDANLLGGDRCGVSCALTEIVGLAVGGDHTCVVFKGGTVRCWGQNEQGALCQENSDDLGDALGELPVADIKIGGKVLQASSGGAHTCGLLDSGEVRCWGYDYFGQIGDGLPAGNVCDNPGELPEAVIVGGAVKKIAAGGNHTCAIMQGGTVRCWGEGVSGKLGNEKQGSLYSPDLLDVPGIYGALELALGAHHTCVRQEGGIVRCWGQNSRGQLGLGHVDDVVAMPPDQINLGGPAIQISAGGFHNCALMDDAKVRCWGQGINGALGNGSSADIGDEDGEMPPVALELGGPVKQVATGYAHSCVLLEAGQVRCWGYGEVGSLGYGTGENLFQPGEDVALGNVAVLLGTTAGSVIPGMGGYSTCALLKDQSLRCWGYNKFAQLGLGHRWNIGDNEAPEFKGEGVDNKNGPNFTGPVPF